MQQKILAILTLSIFLFFSSKVKATPPPLCINPSEEAININSLSFFVPEIAHPGYRFTIFDIQKTTQFHITIFYNFPDRTPYYQPVIFLEKIDSNNCLTSNSVIQQSSDTKTFNYGALVGSMEQSFTLGPGEYYLRVYSLDMTGDRLPTTNHYQDYGETIIIGNTSQYAVDPCEHLFIYPSQSQKSPHSNTNQDFIVVSPPNCKWQAKTTEEWITIDQGDSKHGSDIVQYSVSNNLQEKTRNGSILIWNKVFKVEQEPHKTYLPFIPLLMNNGTK